MPNNRLSALLTALLVLEGCSQGGGATKKPRVPPVPVVVAPAIERTVPLTVRAVGTVDPNASVTVVSRVDGPIVRVFVKDGQEVRVGQPLLQIDPEPLKIQVRMAEAALAKDNAQLTSARSREAHGRALLEQHFIAEDDYRQLKSAFDAATATVKSDEAALDEAKLQLGYSTVRAPVNGKLGHVAIRVGNMVHAAANAPLTTLNGLDRVDVSFTVPEQYLAAVRQALAARTANVAVPVAGAGDLTGALSFVDNAVDRTSGTIGLRASFDNHGRALWPGQFVNVNLSLGSDEVATVVPGIAIAQGPDGSYVFVVRNDLTAEQRRIEVKRTSGELAIVSGVKSGERVVVDGQSRLTGGARVTVRTARA